MATWRKVNKDQHSNHRSQTTPENTHSTKESENIPDCPEPVPRRISAVKEPGAQQRAQSISGSNQKGFNNRPVQNESIAQKGSQKNSGRQSEPVSQDGKSGNGSGRPKGRKVGKKESNTKNKNQINIKNQEVPQKKRSTGQSDWEERV
jgi:type IV secretory pathway VirB10-like protein